MSAYEQHMFSMCYSFFTSEKSVLLRCGEARTWNLIAAEEPIWNLLTPFMASRLFQLH